MKRRLTFNIFVAVLALTAMACDLSGILVENNLAAIEQGSRNVVEETRPVSDVTGVELATIGSVIIQIGENESLRIEAEDNLLKHFDTEVRGGTMRIRTTPSNVNLRPTKPVLFFLTVKDLDRAIIAGSGDIQVPDLETNEFSVDIGGSGSISVGDLNADRLEINIGGSGEVNTGLVKVSNFDVRINGSGDISISGLNADDLSLNVNGSGNLHIDEGEIRNQEIDVNGSGNFRAEDLASENANIRIAGSGNINIWVTESLDVRINGSGDVRYYGRPAVSSTGDGSGDIISFGDK
jgi:hypothetical protein